MDESVEIAAREAAQTAYDAFMSLPYGFRLDVIDDLCEESHYMVLLSLGESLRNENVEQLAKSFVFHVLTSGSSEAISVLSDHGVWGVMRQELVTVSSVYKTVYPERHWSDFSWKQARRQRKFADRGEYEEQAEEWDDD